MISFVARWGKPGMPINQMALDVHGWLTYRIDGPPSKSFQNEGLNLNKLRPVFERRN